MAGAPPAPRTGTHRWLYRTCRTFYVRHNRLYGYVLVRTAQSNSPRLGPKVAANEQISDLPARRDPYVL